MNFLTTLSKPGRTRGPVSINDNDREQWVDNDEGLYNWWRRTGKAKRAFIRANRPTIDAVIQASRTKEPS